MCVYCTMNGGGAVRGHLLIAMIRGLVQWTSINNRDLGGQFSGHLLITVIRGVSSVDIY